MRRYIVLSTLLLTAAITVTVWIAGCSENVLLDQTNPNPNQAPVSALQIDVASGGTNVSWTEATAVTTVTVQFVVRDQSGAPVAPELIDVELFLDDQPIDVEAIFDSNAVSLKSDMLLYLVLDASYSMVADTAFDDMKASAEDLLVDAVQRWDERPGNLEWDVVWFDDSLHQAYSSWDPDDVLRLPTPLPGTFTKLQAAVHYAAGMMYEIGDGASGTGFATGPLDNHVMIVLSDGRDNYSWKDNSSAQPWLIRDLGASTLYTSGGYQSISMNDVTSYLTSERGPDFVHVLGFTNKVDSMELATIAESGNGRYFASDDLSSLFDSVATEITTIQTWGAGMPLMAGDYQFKVKVTYAPLSNIVATYVFDFHGGDDQAGVIGR